MSESRCRFAWSQTSSVLAMLANVNRDPRKIQQVIVLLEDLNSAWKAITD